jgi:hypothetical protein
MFPKDKQTSGQLSYAQVSLEGLSLGNSPDESASKQHLKDRQSPHHGNPSSINGYLIKKISDQHNDIALYCRLFSTGLLDATAHRINPKLAVAYSLSTF